jgi:hypothetical protein
MLAHKNSTSVSPTLDIATTVARQTDGSKLPLRDELQSAAKDYQRWPSHAAVVEVQGERFQ